jgi:hypothetical protein
LPGDIWHLDVCTKCTCRNDSTIQCQKIQCPAQQTICGIGFTAVEAAPTGECCKKYACVPEAKPTEQRTLCAQLVLPKCGLDQTNKIINDTSGCSKYICGKRGVGGKESHFLYQQTFSLISALKRSLSFSFPPCHHPLDCIPKAQCKPVQNFTQLEPGFKAIIDTTGCCPISKLVCDKSLCPPKPAQCTEAFYVLEKTKSADDKICCDIYECRKFLCAARSLRKPEKSLHFTHSHVDTHTHTRLPFSLHDINSLPYVKKLIRNFFTLRSLRSGRRSRSLAFVLLREAQFY